MRDKLAEVIAEAMGYDISDMHRDKPHWVETGGMLNGRLRDVNDPRADDFANASAAVREYLGSDEVVDRAALAAVNWDQARMDMPTLGSVDEFRRDTDRAFYTGQIRAALSSIMEQSDGR